jgi:hypothetical protein
VSLIEVIKGIKRVLRNAERVLAIIDCGPHMLQRFPQL